MTGYKAYQGQQIEGAGPLGLVLLSYEALYKSLGHARRAIDMGDMTIEADQTARAMEAIIQLSNGLNMEEGGKIASGLASLYAYMMKSLSEGMCSGSTAHVDEVIQLVSTLREGWLQLQQQQQQQRSAAKRPVSQPAQMMAYGY